MHWQTLFPSVFSAIYHSIQTQNTLITYFLSAFESQKMFCLVRPRVLSRDLLSFDKCLQLCERLLSNQTISYHRNGYQIVEPFKWTHKKRIIRNDIEKPDYWQSGLVSNHFDLIKNEEQIKGITTSCKIAQKVLTKVGQRLAVRISRKWMLNDTSSFVRSESAAKTSMIWFMSYYCHFWSKTCDWLSVLASNRLCESYGCYPSPLNYKGFPKCVTTSVNNVAVHGIPDSRRLVEGDLITVDVSVYYKGMSMQSWAVMDVNVHHHQ